MCKIRWWHLSVSSLKSHHLCADEGSCLWVNSLNLPDHFLFELYIHSEKCRGTQEPLGCILWFAQLRHTDLEASSNFHTARVNYTPSLGHNIAFAVCPCRLRYKCIIVGRTQKIPGPLVRWPKTSGAVWKDFGYEVKAVGGALEFLDFSSMGDVAGPVRGESPGPFCSRSLHRVILAEGWTLALTPLLTTLPPSVSHPVFAAHLRAAPSPLFLILTASVFRLSQSSVQKPSSWSLHLPVHLLVMSLVKESSLPTTAW